MTRSDAAATSRRRHQLREALVEFAYEPLMRGSLVERRRKCGRANCGCAHDETARHVGLWFSVRVGKRTESFHERPEEAEHLKTATEAYGRLRNILDELTACEVADVRRRTRERLRSQGRRRGD